MRIKLMKTQPIHVNHTDPSGLLSSWSKHSIEVAGNEWPSVEHYAQAMKFDDPDYQTKIRGAVHPRDAKKLGESLFKRKKKSWKREREGHMAAGMYKKCKSHPEVAEALLATGDKPILETSNYDHFWGCGRDNCGQNRFGSVLMAVREKLKAEMV